METKTEEAGETGKDEGTDRASDMRGRFAEQIKRFWRESMKKNDDNSRPVQKKQGPPDMTQ
jgi:hypothetical protein